MARARRKGAVSEALDAGAAAENVERGVSELMELSERSGPPDIPEDLGNFRPDSTPARGAGRAARRQAKPAQADTSRRARPQHLPTFEDESLEQRLQGGEEGPEDETPIREASDLRGPDDEPEEGEEDEEGEEATRPAAPPPDAFDVWRADVESRQARQEAQLNAALAEITRLRGGGTGAAPGAGAALAADPQLVEAARALNFQSVLQVQIDEAAAAELGITPQAAKRLETWLAANIYGNNLRLAKLLAANDQARTHQEQQRTHEQARMQNVAEAFYRANPDLVDFPEEVNEVSARLANQYAGQIDDGTWIRMTSEHVRGRLRRYGVRIAAAAPMPGSGPSVNRRVGIPAAGGMPGRGRIRPAAADFGPGIGGNGHGRPLDPQTKEILDLARFGLQ